MFCGTGGELRLPAIKYAFQSSVEKTLDIPNTKKGQRAEIIEMQALPTPCNPYIFMCVFVTGAGGEGMHTLVHKWRSEDNSHWSDPSFRHTGPGGQTQVIRLVGPSHWTCTRASEQHAVSVNTYKCYVSIKIKVLKKIWMTLQTENIVFLGCPWLQQAALETRGNSFQRMIQLWSLPNKRRKKPKLGLGHSDNKERKQRAPNCFWIHLPYICNDLRLGQPSGPGTQLYLQYVFI